MNIYSASIFLKIASSLLVKYSVRGSNYSHAIVSVSRSLKGKEINIC